MLPSALGRCTPFFVDTALADVKVDLSDATMAKRTVSQECQDWRYQSPLKRLPHVQEAAEWRLTPSVAGASGKRANDATPERPLRPLLGRRHKVRLLAELAARACLRALLSHLFGLG